jgi:hypothetical protein
MKLATESTAEKNNRRVFSCAFCDRDGRSCTPAGVTRLPLVCAKGECCGERERDHCERSTDRLIMYSAVPDSR